MESLELLRQVGATPDFYLLGESEWSTLPKTSSNRYIVCKLPPVYTSYNARSAEKYPEHNKLHTALYEDIEETLYDQAEKHLLTRPNAESFRLVYDMKAQQRAVCKEFEGYKDKAVKGYPQLVPV